MSVEAASEALGVEVGPMDRVSITVASPDVIRSWSKGEVKNPETINYRTFKPEPGGLFCQKIFGPVRDYECACGKYKRIKYKGVVCDRCGVEVTVSRVRRDRMGHIELAVPVSHIWFLKSMPSRLGLLLNMTAKSLERVLYYEQYMVTDPGSTPLEEKQLLSDKEFREAQDEFGDEFEAKMGAEAVRDVLGRINLEDELEELYDQMHDTKSKQIKKKLSSRLKVIQGFINSGASPEWMVLDSIPVIPPDLRPLVPLEGGRFATSDLNDLYRRVINRNNRLKNLLQLKTPDVIIHNEKRMLQEAVDALFDNGRHGRAITGSGNRALKSLSDMLKGKQGRFRQNLLGKRVDYSGRSVIVIGPELKLHQCGIPKKMALILFEPFIIRRLKELGFVHTVRGARKMIESRSPEVWDILEEVTKGHPVLLNRAPTLHRLSIQAFEPVLIEGNAIRVHPLVCTPYNADFDGDQMAVHVPLSVEAIMEAKLLMMATHNIFSPSSGKPILTPSQDIVLGSYFLTMNPKAGDTPPEGKKLPLIGSLEEALGALQEGVLSLHDWINLKNPDKGRESLFGISKRTFIPTTVGRVLFNTIWPDDLGFFNKPALKGDLGNLILETFKLKGKEETIESLDRLKELGFDMATKAGISIGIFDMIIPSSKEKRISVARKEIDKIEEQFRKGIITRGERHNKIIDVWTTATDDIAKEVFKSLDENMGKDTINPVYLMMDSGARGNRQQVRQLCGMRGLMAKPSGEIIEQPILASFREGLSVLEYFMSTHGARKGLADTALKTADAGYLTRKLCDVAMDCIIVCEDDERRDGVVKKAIMEGDNEVVPLRDRIIGRYSTDDIYDPSNPTEKVIGSGELVTEEIASLIDALGITRVRVMSPLSSRIKNGLTALEYGIDPSTNSLVKEGSSVGIIAAQSIGEPGTQLTMRTFHIGGIASAGREDPVINIRKSGKLNFKGLRLVTLANGQQVTLNKTGSIQVLDEDDRIVDDYPIPAGALLHFKDGDPVDEEALLAQWDPYNIPILSEKKGVIGFEDMLPGVTTKVERDASGGRSMVVIEHKEDLNPQVIVRDTSGNALATYSVPTGAQVAVDEGTKIDAGSIIAKTPRQASKTQDITGGLPRVAELFEARRPKEGNVGQMAKIDGIVSEAGTLRSKKRLLVTNEESGQVEEHLIPHGKHVLVQPGDFAQKGQLITEGAKDPHEILEILGPSAVQEYLIEEIQKVYRLQGVTISDKHLEVIISRMLFKVRITDTGDTDFFWGDQVDRFQFMDANDIIAEKGGKPAEGEPILLGITKASLETDSFISAASFQETTRVLTNAATLGKIDELKGFKENVIMGHLIPAGTGLPKWRRLKIDTLGSGKTEAPQEEVV
jgi:DNA-directed RNA polymerase subunit beta'